MTQPAYTDLKPLRSAAVPKLALRARDVAEALSVSEATARRLIARGTFGPPLRMGGVVRVSVAALQRYIDQQTGRG